MPNTIRHDAITLRSGVRAEDFERFVSDELVPYFSERYRGPTRASRADLKHQWLLKAAGGENAYLWVTAWDGAPDSVAGPAFAGARMTPVEGTAAILARLDGYGVRAPATLYAELADVAVATNR